VVAAISALALVVLAGCGGSGRTTPQLPADLTAALSGQLDCGDTGFVTVRQHRYDYTGDGIPDALVAVRCDVGAGSPPSAVFAVVAGPTGPRVTGELLSPRADEVVSDLSGSGSTAVVTAFAYSPDAARCCPDVQATHTYHWTGTTFDAGTRTATPLPSTRPGDG
jgi:hypothetical protein